MGYTTIREDEPLENSVRFVHAALLEEAARRGLRFRYQTRWGFKASMTLSGIVQQLTPDHGTAGRAKLARLVSQVLRQTGSAVCLHRGEKGGLPTWFVADKLPENIEPIIVYVRGNSARASGDQQGFSERGFLSYEERKLHPEEVGEHLPPGEVTVTTGSTQVRRKLNLTDEQRAAAASRLAEQQRVRQEEHRKLKEQVYEFIATAPIPMTHPELSQLFNAEFKTDWHKTTFRSVLEELVSEGKITYRQETAEERLVRGGGKLPRATGPRIYIMPGDDTPRTTLPKGIEPMKSSQEWADEKKRARESVEKKILRVMDVPNVPSPGGGRPTTVRTIAHAARITEHECEQALRHLINDGKVFYNPGSSQYTVMHRVRKSTIKKWRGKTAPNDLGQPVLPDPDPEPETEPEPRRRRVVSRTEQMVHDAIQEMRESVERNKPQEQPAPLTPTVTDLPAKAQLEVARIVDGVLKLAAAGRPDLEQENERLRGEVARLEAAVTGLRTALAALR